MKSTIATIVTLFAIACSFSTFAKGKTNPLKDFNAAEIALIYVQAITSGNTMYHKHLFTADFEYKNLTNKSTANRKQYLVFLKSSKDLNYNCATSSELLDQSGSSAIAKATLKFDRFTRVDYVTIIRSQDGWKVSKVVTTYL